MSVAADNSIPFRLHEGDAFGFSDEAKPVPVAHFDFELVDLAATAPAASRDWAEGFLAALKFIDAGSNPVRRLHLAEYALGISTSKNQIELARTLAISPAAASQQLNGIKKDFAQIQRLFADIRRYSPRRT